MSTAEVDLDEERVDASGRRRTVREILMEVDRANAIRCEGCGKVGALILCRRCADAAQARGERPDRRRNRRAIENDVYLLEGADVMELDR